MIKVSYKKDEIIVEGHAMYADMGKDIVCASASSIVITSLNAILRIDSKALDIKKDKGYIKANLKSSDQSILLIFDNMINMLKELSSNYPKNIRVRNEE